MAAQSIAEFFKTTSGIPLPTLPERAKIFSDAGLGAQNQYKGTSADNAALLQHLNTKVTPAATPVAPITPPSSPAVAPAVPAGAGQMAPAATSAPTAGATIPEALPNTREGLYAYLRKKLGIGDLAKSVEDKFSTVPKRSESYATASAALDPQRQLIQDADKQLNEMRQGITNANTEIRDRLRGNGIMTEGSVQRAVAGERAPLVTAFNSLLSNRNVASRNLSADEKVIADKVAREAADNDRAVALAKLRLDNAQNEFTGLYGAGTTDIANNKDNIISSFRDEFGNVSSLVRDPSGKISVKSFGKLAAPTVPKVGATVASDDVETYALQLLNDPKFTKSNVPEKFRAKAIARSEAIKAEADAKQQSLTTTMAVPLSSVQPMHTSTPAFLQ